MFQTRFLSVLAVLLSLCTAILPAAAAEISCDGIYCFSPSDFSSEENLKGICITSLPEEKIGSVMLGDRTLRPGDILTAQQVAMLTFCPLRTETDRSTEVGYLPIYEDSVAPHAAMTISVRGKEDKVPVAEDMATETYKNLPTTVRLKVSDPEGQPLTYALVRQPRRGAVEIREDGSFIYTPKKNKVGVDSFTFTATDPAGKVSREATVTITILKPTDAVQYTDTAGKECQFSAEWMRHTGIFAGENLAGNPCFSPDKAVTRGEFTSMLVKTMDLKPEPDLSLTGYTDEIPAWLQPYLAAAVRSGLTAGLPQQEAFGPNEAITGAEAAVMLQNALDLTVSPSDSANAAVPDAMTPVWAEDALNALSDHDMDLDAYAVLSRGDASQILYQAAWMMDHPVFTE
jgi:hypothetical protein